MGDICKGRRGAGGGQKGQKGERKVLGGGKGGVYLSTLFFFFPLGFCVLCCAVLYYSLKIGLDLIEFVSITSRSDGGINEW